MATQQSIDAKETTRVEAFSDGVFAIAVTLLVLEVKVPHVPEQAPASLLWRELARQWPSYIALISSFFTVLIMWTNHHSIFKMIVSTNSRFMFANGFLLLMVSLVPFPTALIAEYIQAESASVACAVYAGMFVIIAFAYSLLWEVALRSKLVSSTIPAPVIRATSRNGVVGITAYAVATAAAFFSPYLSLGICTALWLFWGFTMSQD
ncbi:TMEM175 family protein [uncultured Fibrella sp.]|uniref:TMEM175 family protein n=1 Tax=uncultured Fibrella sp. TaxID=1284596 RepID=UPI0035C98F23